MSGQGLMPADFGENNWDEVLPSGRPSVGPAGSAPSRVNRARFYWTLRFMLWDAEQDYAAGTRMSREGFSPQLLTYANTNNFGSRFWYPGRGDNESLLAFDWIDMGRQKSTSLLWSEDWMGDGVAFQLSYYAAIFRAGQRASNGSTDYGMYLVPRAATGWPPGSGAERHMKGGLFRKIMTFIGQGAKAIK